MYGGGAFQYIWLFECANFGQQTHARLGRHSCFVRSGAPARSRTQSSRISFVDSFQCRTLSFTYVVLELTNAEKPNDIDENDENDENDKRTFNVVHSSWDPFRIVFILIHTFYVSQELYLTRVLCVVVNDD